MSAPRHAREIYEVNVRTGAYGKRRWVLIPIGAFLMVVIAATGFLVLNRMPGHWYLVALGVASVLLLMIPILVRKLRSRWQM